MLARVRFCEAKGLGECVWEWEDLEEEGEREGLWRELPGVGSEVVMCLCDIININKPRRGRTEIILNRCIKRSLTPLTKLYKI